MRAAKHVKQSLMEQYSRIAKAVSHPRRLELLDLLCQGSRTVEELARTIGASVATTSQHLQVLKRARLVESEKRGLYVHYALADRAVCEFWRSLQSLGATRLAEVRQTLHDYFHARDVLEPITSSQLADWISAGQVLVVDVRPMVEYAQGHIPGALSVPLDELESRAEGLPRDVEIVAYCRGPYCVLSPAAVEALTSRGFRARRLLDGLPDWAMAGHPVERYTTPTPHSIGEHA
ncbi:metalloregulator ArsR/SmtB family transcription factor [Candidatus Poribacteria bacterium]|nr:metalloregulator ArsR/SmtB family transcription factor [Candidatus Poribacteria bacterium]